jgi:Niemann-Pick C1 protein
MVVMSMVDVCGFMHFWGVTIDTVSCIIVVIAIGLSVDYSVHIAHAFISEDGQVSVLSSFLRLFIIS